jgi:hypothetical protein
MRRDRAPDLVLDLRVLDDGDRIARTMPGAGGGDGVAAGPVDGVGDTRMVVVELDGGPHAVMVPVHVPFVYDVATIRDVSTPSRLITA